MSFQLKERRRWILAFAVVTAGFLLAVTVMLTSRSTRADPEHPLPSISTIVQGKQWSLKTEAIDSNLSPICLQLLISPRCLTMRKQ